MHSNKELIRLTAQMNNSLHLTVFFFINKFYSYHPLCNCPVLSRLRLNTLGRASLRVWILCREPISIIVGDDWEVLGPYQRRPVLPFSFCFVCAILSHSPFSTFSFCLVCAIPSHSSFSTFSPFFYPIYYAYFLRTLYNGSIPLPVIVFGSLDKYTFSNLTFYCWQQQIIFFSFSHKPTILIVHSY